MHVNADSNEETCIQVLAKSKTSRKEKQERYKTKITLKL